MAPRALVTGPHSQRLPQVEFAPGPGTCTSVDQMKLIPRLTFLTMFPFDAHIILGVLPMRPFCAGTSLLPHNPFTWLLASDTLQRRTIELDNGREAWLRSIHHSPITVEGSRVVTPGKKIRRRWKSPLELPVSGTLQSSQTREPNIVVIIHVCSSAVLERYANPAVCPLRLPLLRIIAIIKHR